MGLFDIFNGMQNGPRGGSAGGGGMSPITMALLGLVAYKAIKGFGGSAASPAPRPAVGPAAAAGWAICSRPEVWVDLADSGPDWAPVAWAPS